MLMYSNLTQMLTVRVGKLDKNCVNPHHSKYYTFLFTSGYVNLSTLF